LSYWEKLVFKCNRGTIYESECESAVDRFGFVEFESPLFVPRRELVEMGLNSIGCLKKVMVKG